MPITKLLEENAKKYGDDIALVEINPQQPEDRRITPLAFLNRFTQPERVALEMSSLDNPSATAAQRQQAAALRVMQDDVKAATWIDLARGDTRGGVQQLETIGLLSAGRAGEILDAAIQPHERPAGL